jgi:hypothetical protein
MIGDAFATVQKWHCCFGLAQTAEAKQHLRVRRWTSTCSRTVTGYGLSRGSSAPGLECRRQRLPRPDRQEDLRPTPTHEAGRSASSQGKSCSSSFSYCASRRLFRLGRPVLVR